MYTTFSSRPGGAAGTNIHTNTTPYGASPGTPVRSTTETSPIKFTFSAKTGELCSRATGELRRKRVEEQGDDVSGSTSNKRVETGGDSQSKGGGNSSAARVSVTSQAPSSTSNEYSQGREGSTKVCNFFGGGGKPIPLSATARSKRELT